MSDAGIPVTSPAVALETADQDTASDDYATRFRGPVGAWFLELQARYTIALLDHLPRPLRVLEVGGGHAQLVPALVAHGCEVVVLGSDPAAGRRLAPWVDAGTCRFDVGNPAAPPYPDRSFDVVLSFRMLPHVRDWRTFTAALCRVANRSVIVDYPSVRSVNRWSERLFGLKRGIERNTRPFRLFEPAEVRDVFALSGFRVADTRAQFFLPMVVHRALGMVRVSRGLEGAAARLRLTRRFGSPIIVRADRTAAPQQP